MKRIRKGRDPMMKNYVKVYTNFWSDPIVAEEMNLDERLVYLYLLMNQQRFKSKDGIYRISIKRIAYELDFSIELVNDLIDRLAEQFKLINYNHKTKELMISNHGKAYVQV